MYFRVRPRRCAATLPDLHRDSLARKLAIKPDSPFYDWLERELAQRFDFACCATQEQFRRETRAITRAGQIKAPGERHEKDDRHRIDDRSRYVLGWTQRGQDRRAGRQGARAARRGWANAAAASAALQKEQRRRCERPAGADQAGGICRLRRTRLAAAGRRDRPPARTRSASWKRRPTCCKALAEQLDALEQALHETEPTAGSTRGQAAPRRSRSSDARRACARQTAGAGSTTPADASVMPVLRACSKPCAPRRWASTS